MNLKYIAYIILISLNIACNSDNSNTSHDHGPNGHSHGPSQPRTDQTIWTDKTELFVEYPVLVVDKPSRFAAHFTILKDHQPVEVGQVKVSLKNSIHEQNSTVEKPSSSGIFKPTLKPRESGIYSLIFDVNTPNFKDQITLNNIQVFESVEAANKVYGQSNKDNGNITFLKEQAWKLEFQTAKAKKDTISDIIKTSGNWKASPSGIKQIVATAKGVISFQGNNLTKGTSVKKGQILMVINSSHLTANNHQAQISNALARYNSLQQKYDRKKVLISQNIITKSEFEKVKEEYLIAKTNYETLVAGTSKHGKVITSPFDGVITQMDIINGCFVSEGQALLVVSKPNSKLLEFTVSPSYAQQLNYINNIWYKTDPHTWHSLKETGGEIIAINKTIDFTHPLLTVSAQIKDSVDYPIGSFTEVQMAIGDQTQATVIPEMALLEDYGVYSVIVQLTGESFERRLITIGKRNGEYIEVLKGLKPGEVVVTKGAYQVKMASMSGQAPAHGHAH